MSHEREIAEEQEFLDVALEALDQMRQGARSLRDSAAVANMRGAGDLVERDVVMGTALHRLDQLAIGDQPLFFGRIDYQANGHGRGDTYHVGRLAVSDESLNPLVIDWRAPVAEAFYRATGVESLGLSRRRHVAIHANEVTGVEDEYFADSNGELDLPDSDVRAATEEGLVDGGLALGGPGALLAALGRARTGRMGDIIATIQGEQDQIIRSPLAGHLVGSRWPRHRQDRRCSAPRGVPALHLPRDARAPGCSRGGTEPAVPQLHRERAALAGRIRRHAVDHRGPRDQHRGARRRLRRRRPAEG